MKLVIDNEKISLKYATSFKDRLLGFMFKKNINYCLCFPKCNSIHTFFMLSKIDVVMTDKDNNILYTFYGLKPWKVILPKRGVYYTYEFPNGYFSWFFEWLVYHSFLEISMFFYKNTIKKNY